LFRPRFALQGLAPIRFTINIGQNADHSLGFRWNQITGRAEITVDGVVVQRRLVVFSLTPVRTYSVEVGTERIPVRIEQERRLLFPFLFPNKYRVFVDGEFLKCLKGY
jgi:hypothetical protein